MAESKSKTVKKVTKIPEASVTIEVEQTEDEAAKSETVEAENPDQTETTEEETPKEPEQSPEGILPPVNSSLDELGDDSGSSFGWKKVFVFTGVAAIIGFLIVGGFLYFQKNYKFNLSKTTDSNKSIEIANPTAAPTKVPVDKEAYVIEIQNGSGIAGEGARVKETLEAAGFKVGLVGNADNSNYTDTIIKVNDEVTKGYIEALTKTLEERGSVGDLGKITTGQDGQVIIILGSNVKDTPTPTP